MSTANIIDPSELTAMAHRDLACYSIAQLPNFERAPHHERIIAKLEAVERGKIKRLMILPAAALWKKPYHQSDLPSVVSR